MCGAHRYMCPNTPTRRIVNYLGGEGLWRISIAIHHLGAGHLGVHVVFPFNHAVSLSHRTGWYFRKLTFAHIMWKTLPDIDGFLSSRMDSWLGLGGDGKENLVTNVRQKEAKTTLLSIKLCTVDLRCQKKGNTDAGFQLLSEVWTLLSSTLWLKTSGGTRPTEQDALGGRCTSAVCTSLLYFSHFSLHQLPLPCLPQITSSEPWTLSKLQLLRLNEVLLLQ